MIKKVLCSLVTAVGLHISSCHQLLNPTLITSLTCSVVLGNEACLWIKIRESTRSNNEENLTQRHLPHDVTPLIAH